MRTTLIALTLAAVAIGCANSNDPQPAKDPIGAQINQSQTPATNPTPQDPNDPMAMNGTNHGSREPASVPKSHDPQFSAGEPQQAINDPASQKPFYLGGPGSGGNKVLAKTEKPMTDAEILGVLINANDGEVKMAEQAAKKGKSQDVKAFATMMKTHHSQGLTKSKATATKTKITQTDSDLSAFLKGDTEKTVKDLQDKEGKDFDKAYMDAQVAAHKAVLAALDNRLVPGAQNADVKALVTETRKTVSDHLAKAEELSKKVDATASFDTSTEGTVTTSKAKTEKGLEQRP